MTRVIVRGDGYLLRPLMDELAVDRAVELVSDPSAADAVVDLTGSGLETDGPRPALRLDAGPEVPTYHSCFSSMQGTAREWRIPSPPLVAALHAVAAIGEVRRVHLTEIAPASIDDACGPVDALVPLTPADGDVPSLPAGVTWSRSAVAAPHTRCWLIGVTAELEDDARSAAARLLDRPSPLTAVPERLGVRDTAALAEYARDAGAADASFGEVFFFPSSLHASDRLLQVWLAAHERVRVGEVRVWISDVVSVVGVPVGAESR